VVTCRTDHKFLPNVLPHTALSLHMPSSLLWRWCNVICRLRWIPPLPLISTRPPLGSLITIHPYNCHAMPCVNQIMNAVATTVVMCTACSASVFQDECADTAMATSSPQGSLVALKTKQSLARLGTRIVPSLHVTCWTY
jgi:hypothetical protein